MGKTPERTQPHGDAMAGEWEELQRCYSAGEEEEEEEVEEKGEQRRGGMEMR